MLRRYCLVLFISQLSSQNVERLRPVSSPLYGKREKSEIVLWFLNVKWDSGYQCFRLK